MLNTRICMISFRWPPVYGGSGMQAQRLAVRLAKRGISVFVLTARLEKNLARRESLDGIPVERLPVFPLRRLRSMFFSLSASWHLLRHGKDADIVHILGAYLRGVPIIAVSRLLGKKTVVKMTSQGTDDPASIRQRRFGAMLRWAMARSDAVVSLGGDMSASYRDSGFPERKLVEIPNGVSTDVFRRAAPDERRRIRERLDLPAGAEVVIFVGPVSHRKGVDTLVQAWPRVVERRPHALLLVLGPITDDALGGYPSVDVAVRQSARTLVLGPKQNVGDYLRASDVFVLPTRMEGLSNALLEAMAAGLASVVSRIPGTEEVTDHGRCAILVDPGDATRLAEAIVELLDNPVKRHVLGDEARGRIKEKYSMEAVSDAYARLYTRLMAQEDGRRGGG